LFLFGLWRVNIHVCELYTRTRLHVKTVKRFVTIACVRDGSTSTWGFKWFEQKKRSSIIYRPNSPESPGIELRGTRKTIALETFNGESRTTVDASADRSARISRTTPATGDGTRCDFMVFTRWPQVIRSLTRHVFACPVSASAASRRTETFRLEPQAKQRGRPTPRYRSRTVVAGQWSNSNTARRARRSGGHYTFSRGRFDGENHAERIGDG